MRTYWVIILTMLFASTGRALVYWDSEVLDVAGMEKNGIEVKVIAPADKQAGLLVRFSISPDFVERDYRDMAYVVLDKQIDDSFKNAGITRDVEKWAKPTKKRSTEKTLWTIAVPEMEIPYSYVVVRYILPERDGFPVMARFYILMSQLKASQAAENKPHI